MKIKFNLHDTEKNKVLHGNLCMISNCGKLKRKGIDVDHNM